jgi:hypothetical protein
MTTVNTNIQQLQEQIKQGRLNKDSDNQLEFKQGLLQSLKTCSKEKQLEVLELSNNDYLDVVKKRFNVARSAAITIISKSDKKDIGTQIAALVILPKDDQEEEIKITYDQLTLEQILSLNPTNTNLNSLVQELEYLQSLLPQQLTQDQMLEVINSNNLTNIKDIMNYFKVTYVNQYDTKLLASIAKTVV